MPALDREQTRAIGVYAYSDLGYAVLTRILESVTGRAWLELARDHILSPLGVTDVGVDPTDPRVPIVRDWSGAPRTHWSMHVGPFVGSGGLLSTIEVLESYALASARHAADHDWLIGWERTGEHWWHHGQTRDHGAWVGVGVDATWAITVHMIGYAIFRPTWPPPDFATWAVRRLAVTRWTAPTNWMRTAPNVRRPSGRPVATSARCRSPA